MTFSGTGVRSGRMTPGSCPASHKKEHSLFLTRFPTEITAGVFRSTYGLVSTLPNGGIIMGIDVLVDVLPFAVMKLIGGASS